MSRHRDPSDRPSAEETRAVTEARQVLSSRWPQWAERAGLDPVPTLQLEQPRVDVFGVDPADLHLVATIHFSFVAGGVTFHGKARGPRDDGLFEVRRDIGPPEAGRRRWRR